jgi:branched-chain amino acid transport system substrate-binding protein
VKNMIFKCIALVLAAASQIGFAQILIGQTAGFTGPVGAGVKETTDGAKLYIDAINTKGGVNGQKIELISLDDKFDTKLAAENARKLIEEQGVVAMFLTRGTPHTQAIIPLLDKYNVPLVGPSTGAAPACAKEYFQCPGNLSTRSRKGHRSPQLYGNDPNCNCLC